MGRMVLGFLLAALMANPFCCCVAAGGCGVGIPPEPGEAVCPHCRMSQGTTAEQVADSTGGSPNERIPTPPDCPNCPNRMQKKAADSDHALASILVAPVRDLNFQDSDWDLSSLMRRTLADGSDPSRPGRGWLALPVALDPSPPLHCVFLL